MNFYWISQDGTNLEDYSNWVDENGNTGGVPSSGDTATFCYPVTVNELTFYPSVWPDTGSCSANDVYVCEDTAISGGDFYGTITLGNHSALYGGNYYGKLLMVQPFQSAAIYDGNFYNRILVAPDSQLPIYGGNYYGSVEIHGVVAGTSSSPVTFYGKTAITLTGDNDQLTYCVFNSQVTISQPPC
jgi:hypothetical protein